MVMRPLSGRRVVTTRDRRGRLDSLLAAAGADVVHVPLISIERVDDAPLAGALAALDTFDWLVVTSGHGADRVGDAAAGFPSLRLAAVGSRTAETLSRRAGRPVDVVPGRQTAADLVRALDGRSGRVLVAQADRADDVLVAGLAESGFDVESVVAYRTVLRAPNRNERLAISAADAVGFASGSAVEAWVDALGVETPLVAAAIGPTTATVAGRLGLKITHTAADHDVEGLAEVISAALTVRP